MSNIYSAASNFAMKINPSFIADTAFRERSSYFNSKLSSLAVTINKVNNVLGMVSWPSN